jgi:phytoene synthase
VSAPLSPELALAYARCEQITRAEAKNFSYGIRLLPGEKRRAMSALYAVARRIDDIGDGGAAGGAGPRPDATDKRTALKAVRADLAHVAEHGTSPDAADPVLVALADVTHRFPLPMAALEELVDGCEMDVDMDRDGRRYATFEDLVGYCRRVAGTVGRLSIAVYGTPDPAVAEPLADTLGVALQVTNILRDIVEDRREMGRVYLPTEDLRRFGVADDLSGPEEGLIGVILYEAARAERRYAEGLPLLDMLDRRSRACTAAMAGIYRRLLRRIQADPAQVLRRRVSLPAHEKAAVAARALTVGRP